MKTTVRTHSRRLPSGRTVTVRKHTRGYTPGDPRPFTGKGIYRLPVRTAIIVPSTTGKDEPISKQAFDRRVEETRKFLSDTNGGYTSVKAVGGYTDKETGKVIKEPVIVVESFAERKVFQKNKGRVRKWLERKGRAWGQQSMGYEHEDDLYYVDSK